MIECQLRKIKEFIHYDGLEKKEKLGRYHGSNFFDIPEFGRKRWVVAAYIDADFEPFVINKSTGDIVQECINFLNQPPPRKKFAKRVKRPLYGKLEVYKYKLREDKSGKLYAEVLLITNQKKNRHFWGRGLNV
jgi:hypothetical protein